MSVRLLPEWSHAALRSAASDLRTGRGVPPMAVTELAARYGQEPVAQMLELLAAEREAAERAADGRVELVWSGPEGDGAGTRDTAVVVRDLFQCAKRSVLVSGYVVFDGESVFEALWERWEAVPTLQIELYLNVGRPEGDRDPPEVVATRFRERFFARDWPWRRRPSVYYDPRSLNLTDIPKSVLHAKCIVVDDIRAFVTSANLTEAAQYRNIEAGVLLNDSHLAARLAMQFRRLRESASLIPL